MKIILFWLKLLPQNYSLPLKYYEANLSFQQLYGPLVESLEKVWKLQFDWLQQTKQNQKPNKTISSFSYFFSKRKIKQFPLPGYSTPEVSKKKNKGQQATEQYCSFL